MSAGPKALPVYFLAHGSPMNALEDNYFTKDWHNITADLKKHPKPKAIVVLSAHWHVAGTFISSNKKPPTIHDFGAFPQSLFDCQYPCDGSPELATTIKKQLQKAGFAANTTDQWGLDHGTWVLLKHLYPKAEIPVLQLSLDNRTNDGQHHYLVAHALKPLREQGVLFIGSGNIVHNITKWMSMRPGDDIAWAVEFDKAICNALNTNDFNAIANYQTLNYAQEAVPTIEHFLPLIYCLGLIGDKAFQFHNTQIKFSDFGFEDLSTACSRSIAFI